MTLSVLMSLKVCKNWSFQQARMIASLLTGVCVCVSVNVTVDTVFLSNATPSIC